MRVIELLAADVFTHVEQTPATSTRNDIIELDEALTIGQRLSSGSG